MPTVIQPYRKEHELAVGEFNRRLQQASGVPDLVFSETAVPRWLPPAPGVSVWNEFFVTTEEPHIRGAYGLKQEQVYIRGKGEYRVACYHHALSEGIINRAYANVGSLLVRDALARQPLLYALGMGGFERPLARMLKALGFSLSLVPFYFRVVHPQVFLREMQTLRDLRWRAVLMNIAAVTGTGWLAIKSAQTASRFRGHGGQFVAEEFNEFSTWADDLWDKGKDSASMAAVRDAKTLQLLYPATDTFFTRVQVKREGTPVGWAVVGERRRDPKFGAMRVGSIVDCWALPENAVPVIRAATTVLEKRGVDLIVSNQSHQLWCRALKQSGFLHGPSTFIFAASKKLTELLEPFEENRTSFHISRADGDGLPRNF